MAIKPDELRPITIGPDGQPLAPAPIQVQEPDEAAPPSAAAPSQAVPSNWSNQLRQRVAGSPVIPAEVAQQMPVWHKRTGAYEHGPSAAQPQFDYSLKAPSQRPDVPAIYKKAGVQLRTGDKLLPESAFDHNIPWAVKLPDGRVIQAANQQEFGLLLYRVMKEGGPVPDDNIQEPTQNYDVNDIAATLDAGDDAGADWMMYQNYRAGNITVQQYEDFANHRKTLGQLLKENPDIGKFNNNPTKEKIQYISAQDYNEWANERNRGLVDNYISFQEAHDEVDKLSAYLWQVKYARAQAFRKEYAKEIAQDGFEQTFNDYGKDDKGVPDPYYFPEFPDNFLDWTEIPDEWLMKDSKGANVIGLDVPRFPAALKAQYEKAQQEHEAFLTSQLPDGYKAKIVQGGWTTPDYQIQFFTPEGKLIKEGGTLGPYPESYSFPPAEVESFRQWATDNQDKYIVLMTNTAKTNPQLVTSVIKTLYPDYTIDQIEGIVNAFNYQEDKLPAIVQKIAEAPTHADGTPDPIAREITMGPNPGGQIDPVTGYPIDNPMTKWDEIFNLITPWQSGVDKPEEWAKGQIRSFLDIETIPDRVKSFALNTALSLFDKGLIKNAIQMSNVFTKAQEVWDIVSTGAGRADNEPYKVWEGPILINNVPPVPFNVKFDLPLLGEQEISNQDSAITLKGVLSWLNPQNLMPAGEGVKAIRPGQELVMEAVSMASKNYTREEMISILSKAAKKAGLSPEDVADDAIRIFNERLAKVLSPDTFKAPPKPVEVTPGEPFDPKAKYDSQNGVPIKIETPEFKIAGPGEPVDYVDPATQKPYTRVDNKTPQQLNDNTPPPPAASGKQPTGPGEPGGTGQPTGIKSNNTPVDTQSESFKVLKTDLESISDIDPTYNPMSIDDDAARGMDFVNTNPELATKIIAGKGSVPASANVTDTAFRWAYYRKAMADGKMKEATKAANSIIATNIRKGQEVVANRGQVNNNDAMHFIERVSDARRARVNSELGKATRGKVKANDQVKNTVKELKTEIGKKQIKSKELQQFFKDLICPE